MSEVVSEIIDGIVLERSAAGDSLTIPHLVSRLTGSPSGRIFAALNAPGVPLLYDPHRARPDLYVNSLRVRLGGPESATVECTYGIPGGGILPGQEPSETGPAEVEVGATVAEMETGFDASGNQIFTEHVSGEFIPATVRVFVPTVYVRFTRREPVSPGAKAKRFVGKVNSQNAFGDPPKWWLCMGITGRSADGGQVYTTTYEFQRGAGPPLEPGWPDGTGWQAVVVEHDANGNFVLDPVYGYGLKVVNVYKSDNFNDLNLTL